MAPFCEIATELERSKQPGGRKVTLQHLNQTGNLHV